MVIETVTTHDATKLDLQLRIDRLRATIKPLQDELDATERQLLEVISPFKTGDVIEWDSGKTVARGRVIGIIRDYGDDCHWRVQRILKDGRDGDKKKVYHWDKPRRVELRDVT